MTKDNKDYLIAFVWLLCGYACWVSADNLFIWGTSNLIQPTSKYIRSVFHLNFSSEFVAFMLLQMTDLIIVFSIAFLLSMAIGKRKIWLFLFIIGVVGRPLYETLQSNITFVSHYETLPSEVTAVLIQIAAETFIAYVIVIPLVVWLGSALGNLAREKLTGAMSSQKK